MRFPPWLFFVLARRQWEGNVTLPPANYLAGSAGLVASGFLVSAGFGALPPPQPTIERLRPTSTSMAINFFMAFPAYSLKNDQAALTAAAIWQPT